jgi:signal transduction histidine kinase
MRKRAGEGRHGVRPCSHRGSPGCGPEPERIAGAIPPPCPRAPGNLTFTPVMSMPAGGIADSGVGSASRAEPLRRDTSEKTADFHRRIVEGMTCGVFTIDREGLVTIANQHARTTLDLGTMPVLGRHCMEVLTHCPRLAEVLLESFSLASPPSRAEMTIGTRDQRERTIGFSISMIGGIAGQPAAGAALFFKDLTKVEEQEERERLRDRLAVLGEMAAQMAHEIRNPLTSIDVSATLQKRRLVARGESTDLVDKISKEAGRIEATIANCLDYARPLDLSLAHADPVELIDEALEEGRQRARGGAVEVERRAAGDLGELVCDGPLLKQALTNVFSNAFEAMPNGGRLFISVESAPARAVVEGGDEHAAPHHGAPEESALTDQYLLIRVQDTGPGIAPELRDRVFYPFFTTKTSGSGIGLAAARKVVEAHGGWLDLETAAETGAIFIFKMPMGTKTGSRGRGVKV